LKEEYERLKEESERAAETSTFNYHKQRGIKAEIKQYEEQKSEAERYEATVEQRVIDLLGRSNPRIKLL
jgi:structural maintenance of chromosome 1